MRHAIPRPPRPRPPDDCCKTTAPSNRAYCVPESRYVRTLPAVVAVLALGRLQSTPPHEQSLRRKNKQLLVANIRDRGKWRPDCGRPQKECLRVHGRYVSFCAGDDEARDRNPTRGPAARRQAIAPGISGRQVPLQRGGGGGERGRLDLMSDNDAKCIAETPEQPPWDGMGCEWDVREI